MDIKEILSIHISLFQLIQLVTVKDMEFLIENEEDYEKYQKAVDEIAEIIKKYGDSGIVAIEHAAKEVIYTKLSSLAQEVEREEHNEDDDIAYR